MRTDTTSAPAFAALLASVLTEPGKISAAYSAFHHYSLGNMLLALGQCAERGIAPGPLATFPAWKARGRFVRKGEKAITLCQPITVTRKAETEGEDDATFTRFVYKPHWFVLAQTDGAEYASEHPAEWDKTRALEALNVTEIPFDLLEGNCQGFARDRSVAVSPVAAHPFKTLFHELAHVLLGHTAEGLNADDERTPRTLREVEAESVAMLVSAALGLDGIEYSRGYIQHWNQDGNAIPEKSAAKIFKVADQILRAGRPVSNETDHEGGAR